MKASKIIPTLLITISLFLIGINISAQIDSAINTCINKDKLAPGMMRICTSFVYSEDNDDEIRENYRDISWQEESNLKMSTREGCHWFCDTLQASISNESSQQQLITININGFNWLTSNNLWGQSASISECQKGVTFSGNYTQGSLRAGGEAKKREFQITLVCN